MNLIGRPAQLTLYRNSELFHSAFLLFLKKKNKRGVFYKEVVA